jgi:serine/threonine-protein kinase
MSGEEIAGRYRLIERIGRGAMSSVWLAQDSELERRVAVKLLSPAAGRARFEREARAAASLSHPNVCSLYDYGESDGKPFMVLEYLPNGSLEERLKEPNPLPDLQTRRIAAEIAAGLAHAHGRGLVHRDLKPSNVLFDSEGRAKIADFGIAHMGDAGALTEAGTVLGTASYISPEQASGSTAGPPSDVYSFGVILFRMLTGRLPFVATNTMEVVRMQRDDPPPPVAAFRSGAPMRLENLANASLTKDPARRPADGAALLRELQGTEEAATTLIAAGALNPPGALDASAATDATRVIRPPPSRQTRRPARVLALALVAALALLGLGVAFAFLSAGGGDSGSSSSPLPPIDLPTVTTLAPISPATTTEPATTAVTTTAPATTSPATTTAPVTTAPVTTTAATTTAPATTAPVTTAITTLPATVPTVSTVPPTTTVAPPPAPTTTAPATTAPVTTAPVTTAPVTTTPVTTTPATTAPAPAAPGP